MWLETSNNIIESIVDLAIPSNKGDVNNKLKKFRDERIHTRTSDIDMFLEFYIEANSSNSKKENSFDFLRKLQKQKEKENIEDKISTITNMFPTEMVADVESKIIELQNETDRQCMFEFTKGVYSLKAHIEKFVDNPASV